jgi:DNA-nicking Smr family endonuclease
MSNRRALDATERALWERVMASVKPLHAAKGHPVKMQARAGTQAGPMVRATRPTKRVEAVALSPTHSAAPTRENFAAMLASPPKPKPAEPVNRSTPAKRIDPLPTPIDGGLDGHWDRRLHKGSIIPDVSVDLHGLGLAHAHARLDGVLEQSIKSGARVILLVTGKPRDHDRALGVGAGRGGRGAIRAAVTDWLAASRHHAGIASVRPAHQRHGGDGALYIILKRR